MILQCFGLHSQVVCYICQFQTKCKFLGARRYNTLNSTTSENTSQFNPDCGSEACYLLVLKPNNVWEEHATPIFKVEVTFLKMKIAMSTRNVGTRLQDYTVLQSKDHILNPYHNENLKTYVK